MSKSIKEALESTFRDVQVSFREDNRMAVTAENESVLPILRFLKDAGFDHLSLISVVDWIEDNLFELCYFLTPYMQNDDEYTDRQKLHIILKTPLPRNEPRFKTVIGLFPNAEPYEREIHEFFGIDFEGHPRLTPLLLERDYEVPPFRKDFDTRKYVAELLDSVPPIETKKK